MRILFILLSALLLAVGLGWLLQQSAGAVVFTYADWTIQTSLVVFVLLFIILFVLVYVLVRLLRKLIQLPAEFRRWSEYRRRRRSEKFLNQGLLAMIESNWPEAERSFRKGAALSLAPLVNYLGAAQAAYRQGDADGCGRYLDLAQQHNDTGSPAPGLARARLQMDEHQVAEADDTLNSLEQGHEQVKLMLLETAAELQDWSRAAGLLRDCRRRGLLSAHQARAKQLELHAGLLQQAGREQDRAALDNAWRAIPYRLKRESALVGAYVRECLRLGDNSGCETVLRRALKREWDPVLAELYGLVEGKSLKRQLEFAEDCLSRYPGDAALLLTLGRLCRKSLLWGKARSYLEQAVRIRPDPGTCRELATLLEQQGEHAAARTWYQQGLTLAGAAPEAAGSTGALVQIS